MGLYIKDLRIPKKRVYVSFTVYPDGRVVHKFGGDPAGRTVEVSAHGRLIDAEAFLKLCKDYAITSSDDEFCKRLEYALTKAVTVIPEEEV